LYDVQAARNGLHRHLEAPLLARLLDVGPGTRVLELGCGTGIALGVMRGRGADVVGVDLHGPAGLRADAARLPFVDGRFDLVLDFGVLQHLPAGGSLALDEVARVLRPGGAYLRETTLAQLVAHPLRAERVRLQVPSSLPLTRQLGFWAVHSRA
jgi:ubiquinone/menaquinone biosynthesis C-methylase UbiE